MKAPIRLLAKSTADPDNPRPAETLVGHTALVLDAADVLLDLRADASLRACGLAADKRAALRRIVRLAAAIHDLGKCSDHFQEVVRRDRDLPQLIRHEALSLWLCWPAQPLAVWARTAVVDDTEHRLAVIAAAAHHRKFWSRAVAVRESGAGSKMVLFTSHPDVASLLAAASTKLGVSPPGPLADIEIAVDRRNDPRRELDSWQVKADDALPPGNPECVLLAVAKAFVLAADVAGSALPRAGEETTWVNTALATRDLSSELRGVVEQRLKGGSLRLFQQVVASSRDPITLVRAGCGSGKTVAAYQWAAQCHPNRRLWMTYPTTGTATEGFRGYVERADIDARLEHGRAEVDVEILKLQDGADGPREADRLDAIRAWSCDVVTCTVDTVLGLVQNQRKGLYAWPSLADGAVVFDEIHAYDGQLFGCLLRFLEALPGIPALLMTASLPEARAAALRDLCRRVHGVELAVVEGPEDLERLPRYRVAQQDDGWGAARAMLEAGGKVLWVNNTVDRCLSVAGAAERLGIAPLIYHSRFKYRDRVERHRDVVAAFDAVGPVLAVTTQVAEMSLDLSADLLVTDLAPVPALIQRLGRLNRRSTPEEPIPPQDCIVLPFDGQPYSPPELDETRRWVHGLSGRELSRSDLVATWDQTGGEEVAPVHSEWLDGGFRTEPALVREGSPGITVILGEDVAGVRRRQVQAAAVAIPMNRPPRGAGDWRCWKQAGFHPVPPAELIQYDTRKGARWSVP